MKIKAFFKKNGLAFSFALLCVSMLLLALPFSSGGYMGPGPHDRIPDYRPYFHIASLVAQSGRTFAALFALITPFWTLFSGFWCFSKKKKRPVLCCSLGVLCIFLNLVDWIYAVLDLLFPVGLIVAALHLLALALQVYALAQRTHNKV
ncbi:hypothetical protein [Acutalibacter intestini]|mgnify:CR=1 FL=1|uniref:hypothetical protein n=1 Tax=Acutalibacter intestini TaxID=3093659 RepID=UPI002AC8EAFB|nr:hypothetical protein [Acutalibacter sp. M00204]